MRKAHSVKRKVLIIQSEMKHYRLPFFTGLFSALSEEGVTLLVAYSNSNPAHSARHDRCELPSPIGLKVKGTWFFKRFLYQPLWSEVFKSDLVIVGPELKYILNPFLLILSALGLKTVSFWGLGPNNHPDRSPLSEWLKLRFFTQVDWWFAYTQTIANYIVRLGMPTSQVTNVQNATDSAGLVHLISTISNEEVNDAKVLLTGEASAQIGLYCGLIGDIKDIPLLVESARLVHQRLPNFHLVIIGNGPEAAWLRESIAGDNYIHYLGSKFGKESALYYKMSDIFLLAGTAGLAIVDSFAAGLPILLTHLATHPPEVSYVIDGYNGRFATHDPFSFADSITELLCDTALISRLRIGAEASGKTYTIEAMVNNYKAGVRLCLDLHHPLSAATAEQLSYRTF